MQMKIEKNESLLSSSVSVSRYLEMENSKDSKGIAAFINERFNERYVKPFEANENKNGFIMMASACLMIEALESFRQGWKKSPNSALAFCQFFDRNGRFSFLRGYSNEFYSHIRCGIMHQGETTGGWHIRRDLDVIFDSTTKTIDATKFLKEMAGSLSEYCNSLEKGSWDSEQWNNLRKKMRDVCANTRPKA
jgi:hypothetical protein